LHGVCYAFFFATVYIFVDEFFPKDARTSAQGLFNVLILGLGPLVANLVWPRVGKYYSTETAPGEVVYEFNKLFLWPSGLALIAAAALFVFFRPPRETTPPSVASH
jgi:MFS family permease